MEQSSFGNSALKELMLTLQYMFCTRGKKLNLLIQNEMFFINLIYDFKCIIQYTTELNTVQITNRRAPILLVVLFMYLKKILPITNFEHLHQFIYTYTGFKIGFKDQRNQLPTSSIHSIKIAWVRSLVSCDISFNKQYRVW